MKSYLHKDEVANLLFVMFDKTFCLLVFVILQNNSFY